MKAKTLAAVLITLFYGISFGAVKIKGKATYITGLEKDVSNAINTSGDDKFYLMGSQMNVDLDVKAELVKDVWAKVKLIINPYSSVPANDWKTVYLNDFMAYFHKDNITLIPFYKAKVVSFGDPAKSLDRFSMYAVNTLSTNISDWRSLSPVHSPVLFNLFNAVVGPVSINDGDIYHMSRIGGVMGGAYMTYGGDWVQAEAVAMQDVLLVQNDHFGLRVGSGVDMDMFQIYGGLVMLQSRFKNSFNYVSSSSRFDWSRRFWVIRRGQLPDKHSEFGGYVKFVMPELVSVAVEGKLVNDTGLVGNPTNSEKLSGMEIFASIGSDFFESMGSLFEVDFFMRSGTDETNRNLNGINIVGKFRGDYDLDSIVVHMGLAVGFYDTKFVEYSGNKAYVGFDTINLPTYKYRSDPLIASGLGVNGGVILDFSPMEIPVFKYVKSEFSIAQDSLDTTNKISLSYMEIRNTVGGKIGDWDVGVGANLFMVNCPGDITNESSSYIPLESKNNTFIVPFAYAKYDFAKDAYVRFSFGYCDDPTFYRLEHGFGYDYQLYKDFTKTGVDEDGDGLFDYYVLKSPYYLAHALRFGFETTVKF